MRSLAAAATAVVVAYLLRRWWLRRALPEVSRNSEDGFHDLDFRIISVRADAVDRQRVHAAGLHQGVRIEFVADLIGPWRSGMLGDTRIRTDSGVVRLASTGPASDALVQSLDRVFGTELSPGRMASSVEFAALSLEGDPADLAAGPVKLKLFFESDNNDRYAELFLNTDLKAKSIGLHEKDEAYREPLIRALMA